LTEKFRVRSSRGADENKVSDAVGHLGEISHRRPAEYFGPLAIRSEYFSGVAARKDVVQRNESELARMG
jgi:hypothetical protein